MHTPFIMDTSGLWLHRNGIEKNFLFGATPLINDKVNELLADNYYADIIEPSLINRYPNIKTDQVI